MKNNCLRIIDNISEEIIALGRELFSHPELGFKEFKTKEIITDYLKGKGFEIEEEYLETGFQVSLGSGYPHIALIAELDAIPTLGHPYANLEDKSAAHACGHSTQCAAVAGALTALSQSGALDQGGKITGFFIPAEEFTDLEYRYDLKQKGKIKTLSGKTNMLVDGFFDDVDLCIHLHAMGNSDYYFSVNSSLAGFVYKRFEFLGRASHAAVLPHLGVNALNAFALFQSASAMLRETFVDADHNRVHGIVSEGGQTVNSIPERVVYEAYIRSFNTATLKKLSQQYTDTAIHCAKALNAECQVTDVPGYLPFKQNRSISNFIYDNMLSFSDATQILDHEESIAAGDIGDLGSFIPAVQFGYGGFSGAIHGKDLMIVDENRVYIETAKLLAMTCIDLLNHPEAVAKIKAAFKPLITMAEYKEYLGLSLSE